KSPAVAGEPMPIMVGREEELAQLRLWFSSALQGKRRVVLITGEPGIGKTAFVKAFLDPLAQDDGVQLGCGQCIEQYGAGEAYMPVLEALTRLGQAPNGKRLVDILLRLAPSWLAQMPALLGEAERERLGRRQAVTRPQMLREMAYALETLTVESPVVLL